MPKVAGSEVYRSELAGAGKKFIGECSCPAFSDRGFCKHLVATALTVNDVEPGVLDETVNRFTRIHDHLHSKDVDTLVTMIMQLADRDPTLLKDLELSALADTAYDQTLFTQFKKTLRLNRNASTHARLRRRSGTMKA